MKFRIAYYLVLLYSTVMLKPVLPILSDAYSHVFAEAIHIATVHAKYGSNHLAYDLAHANDDDTNKNQTTSKSDDPFPLHIFSDQANMFLTSKDDARNYCVFSLAALLPVTIHRYTPPPRLA